MGFGPVERVRTGRGGVVVIPFGKWKPGKKIVHFRWILPEKSVEITLTVILGPVEWVLDQLNGSGRAGVGW